MKGYPMMKTTATMVKTTQYLRGNNIMDGALCETQSVQIYKQVASNEKDLRGCGL